MEVERVVKLIRIFGDLTFEEKNKRVEQDKIIVTKDYQPSFKMGQSVFRERPRPYLIRLIKFWKRPRNLAILLDGCPEVLSLDLKNSEKPAYHFNFGTLKEAIAFLKKVTYKSIAERKPISNNQFLIIALLLGAILMFQFMIMRGITL